MSPRRRVDIWNRVAMFVTLVGIWVLLWDDVSVLSIVSGFLVALIITRVFYLPPVEFSNRVNPWHLLVFLLRLTYDIAVASVRVSYQILTLLGLAALAVGEREHPGLAAVRGCDCDRARRAPDEVGGVRADDEQSPAHGAPASRRDWPTISSRTSSSSNPAPSRRSAQSASPSSTGG